MKFTYPSGSRPLEGYTIKRGVGRGGFGEVYYAISDGGKEVAMKLIRRNLDIELRGVMHCLNLKHPNLIALYDIKQEDGDGDTWVIMEFVGGESLEEVLERNPEGLPAEEVLAWMHGIGAGVSYLHDHGIVHRDLKPGNVFLEDGIVKIGDYGLSKFISTSRRSGQTESVGTVHYMAPEVANGRYGKEIDVYALGIMLYEMLTGRVPFEGESVGEVLMKHLTAQPDLSGLAEPYRTAVERTLEKDPEKRVQNVKQLLDLLPSGGQATPNVHPGFAQTSAGNAGTGAAAQSELFTVRKKGVLQDEPVWQAVSKTAGQLVDAWKTANLNLPAQVILIVLLVMAISTTSGLWIALGVLYLMYLGARMLYFALVQPKDISPAVVPPVPNAKVGEGDTVRVSNVTPSVYGESTSAPQTERERRRESARRHRQSRRRHRRDRPLLALPVKSPRERFTELIGSMLLSALVAAAVAVLFYIVMESHQPEQLGWMALVGTLGSWGVMIPAKFWEGTKGDVLLRRFVMLMVGLVIGAGAYGTDQIFSARLPHDAGLNVPHLEFRRSPMSYVNGESASRASQDSARAEFKESTRGEIVETERTGSGSYFYNTYGDPTMAGYMAYFALLFPILRWWRLADPLRGARVRFASIFMCGLWAWILAMFWEFPEGWGVIAAITIATAVQMASPWFDPQQGRTPQAA